MIVGLVKTTDQKSTANAIDETVDAETDRLLAQAAQIMNAADEFVPADVDTLVS